MDKAGSEGKPWISGLYEYRVTPQLGSIASPLQLITQCTPREKDLPQLPSTLGAQEMYETHQELIRRQQNKLEKNYIELTPGMPEWVQHRQNTSWEPATVVSQCSSNSYWIIQENGTDQPKVYRRTRTMLKIRCTDVRQTRHNYSQSTESEKAKFQTPSTSNAVRNYVEHNSVENVSQDPVHLTKSDTASASLISEPAPQQDRVMEELEIETLSELLVPIEDRSSDIDTLIYQVQPLLGMTHSENLQLRNRNRLEDIADVLGTIAFQGYETLLYKLSMA